MKNRKNPESRAAPVAARLFLALALCAMPTACSHEYTRIDVKPSRQPMFNMTKSSHFLSCVGGLVERRGGPQVDVFVSDIPDHTTPSIESSFLTKNAVMMVTTAIDRLGTERVQVVGKNGARPDRRQVQVLGAFTELNRTIGSNAANAKSRWPMGLRLDFGVDRSSNHIAVDMAMSEFNRIIPQTATSTSVEIETRSGNATLTYDENGDYAAVAALGFTAQEGFHSAERLLIESTIAIMVARYFKIDVRNCLERNTDQNSPDEPVFPVQDSNGGAPSAWAPAAAGNPSEDGRLGLHRIPPSRGQQAGTAPVYLSSEPQSLPSEDSVVILPRGGKKNKYLTDQPDEYTGRKSGDFSGSYTTPQSEGFIDGRGR